MASKSKSKSKSGNVSVDQSDQADQAKQVSPNNKAAQRGSDRLPFEPTSPKKKSKSEKSSSSPSTTATAPKTANRRISKSSRPSRQDSAIPEEISQRMIKRMALLCGIPTVLGLLTFVISYFIVAKGGVELPPIAVLLVSLGFFGLGVLGLSYGALSTSWELGSDSGSLVGWAEFRTNIGRMQQAWKEARDDARS